MKKALTIITVISFVSLAVFGFVGLGHSSFGFSECLSKAQGGGACPGQTNLLEYINFHLGAISSFFNVTIGNQISIILSLIGISFVLSFYLFIRSIPKISLVCAPTRQFSRENKSFVSLVELHLLRSSVFYLRPGPFS